MYNSLVREGQLEPVEITSPTEAVTLVLTPLSTEYAGAHLGDFSYVQVCALINLYDRQSEFQDEKFERRLFSRFTNSIFAPYILLALLRKRFTETTLDCCIIYCELIESEAVCKRILMNFRPRLLQKYKILLVQQELMRAQLLDYLCTSDFFHLPERYQKKLFKLSFQIVSLLRITDRVEQFIINLFRAQLNVNPCIYRCFLQLIYLLISKNFSDNQDRLIRIV